MSKTLGEILADEFLTGITSDIDPWDEEPVDLTTFLYDRGFLALPVLSEPQFDFLDALDDDNPETNKVTEAVLQWGKGSGKDFISGVFIARRCYKLLCLKDPAVYYNLQSGSPLDLINVAFNASQAYGAFFKQFANTVKNKRCFERYGYEIKTGSVHFGKGITAWSGHSDKEGMEGYNLFAAIADEISAFKTDQELGLTEEDKGTSKATRVKGAQSLVRMLRSSITSRFPSVGKLVMLSYPRYAGDFIQQSYEAGRSQIFCYTSKKCTWEVRPDLSKSDFAAEYERDPIEADAKYACNPPHSRSSYHREEQVIDIFDGTLRNAIDRVENRLLPYLTPQLLGLDEDVPCFIHVDLALNHDHAGLAMGYCSGFALRSIIDKWMENDPETQALLERTGEQTTEYKPVVTVPVYTRWKAPSRGEIDFETIRLMIIQLRARGFFIKTVSYDQYQSADSIQILRKLGFHCVLISVDRDMKAHNALRDVVRDRRLRMPSWKDPKETERYRQLYKKDPEEAKTVFAGKSIAQLEPVAEELLGLELINGIKVDHKSDGTKDMADPIAAVTLQSIEHARRSIEATVFDSEDMALERGRSRR